LLFGNKKTIEFRIHTPTYDIDKIMFFIFINSILVNFTKEHVKRILENNEPLTLNSIISEYCEMNKIPFELYNKIIHYISSRKNFVESKNRTGDIYFKESDFTCTKKLNLNFSYNGSTVFDIPFISETIPSINTYNIHSFLSNTNISAIDLIDEL
jgi:hypothetical protein